jgi:hypothetical protein
LIASALLGLGLSPDLVDCIWLRHFLSPAGGNLIVGFKIAEIRGYSPNHRARARQGKARPFSMR